MMKRKLKKEGIHDRKKENEINKRWIKKKKRGEWKKGGQQERQNKKRTNNK